MWEYPSDASPGSRTRGASCKARWGALGTIRVEGSAGKRTFGRETWQLAGIGQQKTLPLPKRGSPAHAPIEFVRRLRLGEGIARKALFIEKGGSGVVIPPITEVLVLERSAAAGQVRRCG